MHPFDTYKFHAVGKDPLTNIEHAIGEAEILLVYRGDGFFIFDDGIFPLQDRCIYFIRENTLHYSAPETPEEYIRSSVNIAASYLWELAAVTGYEEILTELYQRKCILLDHTAAEAVEREFFRLNTDCRKEYAAALLRIFELCHDANRKSVDFDVQNNKVAEAMAYINRNIANKLTLDTISAALFLNKYYLCHLFKKMTGICMTEYILLQRLSLIKEKLRTTDLPVSQLAMEYGFSSFSYFSRVFKEKEGISAREYRHTFRKSTQS